LNAGKRHGGREMQLEESTTVLGILKCSETVGAKTSVVDPEVKSECWRHQVHPFIDGV
jgi:hypothetical protein